MKWSILDKTSMGTIPLYAVLLNLYWNVCVQGKYLGFANIFGKLGKK